MSDQQDKSQVRKQIQAMLDGMSVLDRQAKSLAACSLVSAAPEFTAASVVMLYLSAGTEVDTSPLALKCWQAGKTVVVPKVYWQDRRMLPVEITSLTSGVTTNRHGIKEPESAKPVPLEFIDLVIVPGLAFGEDGYRLGRGMGFYDRFLSSPDFLGVSCGLCFEQQIVEKLPHEAHDVPMSMIASDRGLRRFASYCHARH